MAGRRKKRKPRKKRSPLPNGNGDLVAATVAARVLGLDARTIRLCVREKEWSGRIIRGRVYVHRSVVEAHRDRGEDLQLA